MNIQEDEGNDFHPFQARLLWSEACWLVWRGWARLLDSETRGAVRGTGVPVRWRGSESGW